MRRCEVVEQPCGYRLHEHVAWCHDGDRAWAEALTCFFEEGLADNQRLLYVAARAEAEMLQDLAALPGVDGLLGSGRITLHPLEGRIEAPGRAAPGPVIDGARHLVARALADGYAGLRIGTATSRMLHGHAAVTSHLRFEALIDRLAAREPLVVMCGFDRQAVALAAMQGEFAVHPLRGPGPDAPWLLPVDRDTWVLRGQVDLLTGRGFELALASLPEVLEGDVLHLRTDELEFIDVAGIRALVRVADQMSDNGRMVVLHDTPDWLARMVSVAFGPVPGLDVRVRRPR